MKSSRAGLLYAALVAAITVAAAPIHQALAALPPFDSQGKALPTLAPMLDKVTPAVVNIATRSKVRVRDNPLMMDPFFRRFFGIPDLPQERTTQSLGSGVVVDAKKGYVLTNHHVVDKADEITVTLRDGRSFAATVVGTDPEADVAVLKIAAENLVAVPVADSAQLRVGDFVVAIGNPFGLGQTVTSGIVSALGRSGLGIEGVEDFIQTDASINPGNSGGALVNLAGELVGINTAILAPGGGNVGIGFAIPINMAVSIMDQLVAYGEVRRGKLGVAAQDLTPDLAKAFGLDSTQGAVVSRIVSDSAAARVGLQVGDVVLSIGGRKINNAADLRNAVALLRVGQKAELVVVRDGKQLTLTPVIEDAPVVTLRGDTIDPRLKGAVFQEADESPGSRNGADGLVVAEVAGDSPAWAVGLRPGDVLVSVNRRATRKVKDLQAMAKKIDRMLLHIRRGDSAFFLMVE